MWEKQQWEGIEEGREGRRKGGRNETNERAREGVRRLEWKVRVNRVTEHPSGQGEEEKSNRCRWRKQSKDQGKGRRRRIDKDVRRGIWKEKAWGEGKWGCKRRKEVQKPAVMVPVQREGGKEGGKERGKRKGRRERGGGGLLGLRIGL